MKDKVIWLKLCVFFLSSCGYHFSQKNLILQTEHQVQNIYLEPIQNKTQKPGLESIFWQGLFNGFQREKRVHVVLDKDKADAFLSVVITTLNVTGVGESTVSSLSPEPIGGKLPASDFVVYNSYIAALTCSFALQKKLSPEPLWKHDFTRQKNFASSIQLDVPGTTSALIHESEIERAVAEIVFNMVNDAKESLLSLF